jgi:Uma2 family endonuclease
MQATVRLSQPISDADLERVSVENPGWKVEREFNGALVMSPTTALGSLKNVELTHQVWAFAKLHGGRAFESNAGFTLPDGAVFSPDAAWISEARWAALLPDVQDSYAPIVPDVWIELRSKTDNPKTLLRKLRRIKGFGADYVMLVDPYTRTSWSSGEPPPHFSLDLEAIYDA